MSNHVLHYASHDYRPFIVGVNHEEIEKLVIPTINLELSSPADYWKDEYGYESAIQFLIALNSINYCFWKRTKNGRIERYNYCNEIGAMGMQRAFSVTWGDNNNARDLRDALKDGLPGLMYYFPDIPLPESRAEILTEILEKDYLEIAADQIYGNILNGSFCAENDSMYLASAFPKAYDDRYLKKAQLTMMEISSLFKHENYLNYKELEFTIAADYQLPKVLHGMGILKYNAQLQMDIDCGFYIVENSEVERAIRAATIISCEAIRNIVGINIPELDWWLWSQRNNYTEQHHLTLTTNY